MQRRLEEAKAAGRVARVLGSAERSEVARAVTWAMVVRVCVCHAPNLGAVPSQRALSHFKGGFPRHRTAALFREAWDVTAPGVLE